jgi:hypothetical protein
MRTHNAAAGLFCSVNRNHYKRSYGFARKRGLYFHKAVGVDPHLWLTHHEGRPVQILDRGEPVRELFALHLGSVEFEEKP